MILVQKENFPRAQCRTCWANVVRKCREHEKLFPTDKWKQIDIDIHDLQLRFSDKIFSHGTSLTNRKMVHWFNYSTILAIFLNNALQNYLYGKNISDIDFLLLDHKIFNVYRYEGAAINMSLTNNGGESLNSKIKQKYTKRNKRHLPSFSPKIEQMLYD